MDLVEIYKCLCDRTRLRLLHVLAQGPVCVCHFQEVLGEPQVKISKHLAYLRARAGGMRAAGKLGGLRTAVEALAGAEGEPSMPAGLRAGTSGVQARSRSAEEDRAGVRVGARGRAGEGAGAIPLRLLRRPKIYERRNRFHL